MTNAYIERRVTSTKKRRIPVKSVDEIKNIEIVADVVRFARGGNSAKTILKYAKQAHPGKSDAEIRQACIDAADLMLKQHET